MLIAEFQVPVIGGIFVEIIKDVSMRVAPITKNDSLEMINELKAKKLLDGFRNFPLVNKDKIIELLLKTSKLSMQEKNISEVDFNPVIANEKEAIVIDARIITKDA